MTMFSALRIAPRLRTLIARFVRDSRGLAAVEFAFIAPLMLALTFGTIEISSGFGIDRKVTLTARTLSDLVSQGTKVTAVDISNFFKMGSAIMTPYPVNATTMTQRISAVNIDAGKVARIAWSYNGTGTSSSVTVTSGYAANLIISTIPAALLVPNTQLIWSEVTYTYTPVAGYFIRAAIPLSAQFFTRPRQSDTVTYSAT
ncbi:MAG TPA: TadE/TadG family type IV pilus assembly protein [Afipia sp.]